MNFQYDNSSIPIDNFKEPYVLMSDITSMWNVYEICHYPELDGELMRPELYFTFHLKHVTEFIVLGKWMPWVAVDTFGVVEKNIWNKQSGFPAKKNQSYLVT